MCLIVHCLSWAVDMLDVFFTCTCSYMWKLFLTHDFNTPSQLKSTQVLWITGVHNICLSHVPVMCTGMVLCTVSSKICWSTFPVEVILLLCMMVFEPVELHIHGFWCFRNHGASDETMGCRIICHNISFQEFDIMGQHFYNCRREELVWSLLPRNQMKDDDRQGKDCPVVGHINGVIRKKVISTKMAFAARFWEVAIIRVHC